MDLLLQTWFTSVTFTYMSNLPEEKIMDERGKQGSWLQNLASAVRFSRQVLTLKGLKVRPNLNSDSSVSHPFPSASKLSKTAVGHPNTATTVLCQGDFLLSASHQADHHSAHHGHEGAGCSGSRSWRKPLQPTSSQPLLHNKRRHTHVYIYIYISTAIIFPENFLVSQGQLHWY